MPSLEEEIVGLPADEAARRVRNIRANGEWKRGDLLTSAYWKAHSVNLDEVTPAKSDVQRPGPNDPTAAQQNSSDPIPGIGVFLMVLGVALIGAGFVLPSAIETSSVTSSLGLDYSSAPSFAVNNIGRLNTKMMLVVAGAAFWVGGCVFAARRRSKDD